MSVTVIGERAHAALTFPANHWGWERMLSTETFSQRQRERVLSIVPRVDRWVNLMYPSQVAGNWSPVEAERYAREILRCCGPALLVCAGTRACRAMYAASGRVAYPRSWCDLVQWGEGVHATRIPHPSGRCRIWNDAEVIRGLRERFASCTSGLLDWSTGCTTA